MYVSKISFMCMTDMKKTNIYPVKDNSAMNFVLNFC